MTPKSSTASNGRTSANSTIVWPSEFRSLFGGVFVICGGKWFVGFWWAPDVRGPPKGPVALLDRVGDPVYHGRDVRSEQEQCGEDGRRDHGEDHGVLRHRLSLLAVVPAEERLHVCGELQHQLHLPSGMKGTASRQCRVTQRTE